MRRLDFGVDICPRDSSNGVNVGKVALVAKHLATHGDGLSALRFFEDERADTRHDGRFNCSRRFDAERQAIERMARAA